MNAEDLQQRFAAALKQAAADWKNSKEAQQLEKEIEYMKAVNAVFNGLITKEITR